MASVNHSPARIKKTTTALIVTISLDTSLMTTNSEKVSIDYNIIYSLFWVIMLKLLT